MPMLEKQCERCGEPFKVKPYRAATARHCSVACVRDEVDKVCEHCGNSFTVRRYREETARFCSTTCKDSAQVKIIEVNPDTLKECHRDCGRLLNLSFFYPQKGCKFGVANVCKDCDRERKRQAYEANKEGYSEANKRYREANRARLQASARRKREANKELYREKGREDYRANKSEYIRRAAERRAREVAALGSYTSEQWQEKLEEFNHCCYLCGVDLKGQTIHREHRIPLSRGGDNTIDNLAPACGPCNRRKHTRTEEEYRRLLAESAA